MAISHLWSHFIQSCIKIHRNVNWKSFRIFLLSKILCEPNICAWPSLLCIISVRKNQNLPFGFDVKTCIMNIVRSSVKHAALYDVLWYMQNILWIRNSGNAHYKSMLKCYTGIILLTFLIFSPVNLKLFLYISVAHKLSLMVLPMLYLCFVNEPNSWNSFACSLVRHFSINKIKYFTLENKFQEKQSRANFSARIQL